MYTIVYNIIDTHVNIHINKYLHEFGVGLGVGVGMGMGSFVSFFPFSVSVSLCGTAPDLGFGSGLLASYAAVAYI